MVKFHNFIVNELKETELHSKYTDLIDWKLKDNTDIITYMSDNIIEWSSELNAENSMISEPDRYRCELSLQYPILGINVLRSKKINNILSFHPDLDPANLFKTASDGKIS